MPQQGTNPMTGHQTPNNEALRALLAQVGPERLAGTALLLLGAHQSGFDLRPMAQELGDIVERAELDPAVRAALQAVRAEMTTERAGEAAAIWSPQSPLTDYLRPSHLNLLLGLVWLGAATTEQIQRLWFPAYSPAQVQQVLNRLHLQELIMAQIAPRVAHDTDDRTDGWYTVSYQHRWLVTPAGHALYLSSQNWLCPTLCGAHSCVFCLSPSAMQATPHGNAETPCG